ncbi:MAG TPA: hypothetical protein VNU46_00685, partial [Gemmatimonadaceae bacterium]|nr:hypothetical protein [Gemmatimonadaceae bacterium]
MSSRQEFFQNDDQSAVRRSTVVTANVDMVAVAARYPSVARDFKRADLMLTRKRLSRSESTTLALGGPYSRCRYPPVSCLAVLGAIVGTALSAHRVAAQDYTAADSINAAVQDSFRVDDSTRLRLSVQLSPHVLHF